MSEHAQPGMHPDSDALSAFAEGALAEHERLACLDHLASCAECREIVYLTQAAEAGETEPVKEPTPEAAPFWKRWHKPMPVLSTAAAAALVVVSIVVYRHQTPPPPQPELMAKAEAPPARVATPAMEKAARPVAVRPKAAPAKVSVPLNVATISAPAAAPAAPNAQVQLSGAAGASAFQSTTDTARQYSASGVPPSQNEIQAQPAQVGRADSVVATGNVSESIAVTAELSPLTSPTASGRGGRARSALAATPLAFLAALPSVASGPILLRADAAGALSRSTDAGKSWEAVKGEWQGKVIRLATPPNAPGAGDAVFQLNTDAGQVWFSRDGSQWTAAPAH